MKPSLGPSRFTPAQRYGILVIAGIGFVTVLQRNQSWTARIDDPSPVGHRVNELVGKLDPNNAEATALVAIPGLGERRSRDIVAFREKKNSESNAVIYKEIKDLMQVRGIGPALSKQMEPYLIFPEDSSDESVGSIKNDRDVSSDGNR